ncbi:MAG: hypothetical protein JO166_14730 [Deltaproteobacteria bacterium]|nr:hypothetical protein [Deltaproteobacteria bacterium]
MLIRWSSLPVILLGLLAGNTPILAQSGGSASSNGIRFAQEVAVDECDPPTFNAALGPGECQNFALGYTTTLGLGLLRKVLCITELTALSAPADAALDRVRGSGSECD